MRCSARRRRRFRVPWPPIRQEGRSCMRVAERLIFAVLIVAFSANAAEPRQARGTEPRDRRVKDAAPVVLRSPDAPEFADSEEGCAGGRILDYLERHGDHGRIDPETLLYETRVEHERRDRARRFPEAEGIGGS